MKLIKISIYSIFLFLVCTVVFLNCFESKPEYTPKFKDSVFELITGQSDGKLHIYYKTNRPVASGQKLGEVVFLTAFTGNDKPDINYLDNTIDQAHTGYVEFVLPMSSTDCLATYKNGALIPSMRLEINARFPTPSDAWMCKGFDFKNFKPAH